MSELEIVEAPQNIDWPALHAFIHKTYAYMDARIDPPSSLHRMSVDDFRQKAVDEILIICTKGDEMLGCMFCRDEGDWLYVGKVAVDPSTQGQGIGRRLFDHAFGMAKRNNMQGLELETRIELTENHQAFTKMGFEKVGETAHAGYDKPTAITMRAKL